MMGATAAGDASLIIRRSLEREIGLLEMKKGFAEEEIKEFERKYDMNSADLLIKFEGEGLGDSQDWFLWWVLIRGKKVIEEGIKKTKAVLSYIHVSMLLRDSSDSLLLSTQQS